MSTEPPTREPSLLARRGLLRLAGLAALAPFGVAFASMLERLEATRPPRQVRVGPDLPDAVTFAGDVLVRRDEEGHLTVLSSRCTHLGCRIQKLEGEQLVCPCHGSRFRLDGSVAVGPAARPLAVLPHTVERGTGALLVDLS